MQQQQQQIPFQPKIIEPPENIKEIIDHTIKILREQGFEKEEQLKLEHQNDPNYQFLFFNTQYFWYYSEIKRELLQELMHQTQQKLMQQGAAGMPNMPIPHNNNQPLLVPPHLPPGMVGIPPGFPNLPPPPNHLQMPFLGQQNRQFNPQQQQQQQHQQIQQGHPPHSSQQGNNLVIPNMNQFDQGNNLIIPNINQFDQGNNLIIPNMNQFDQGNQVMSPPQQIFNPPFINQFGPQQHGQNMGHPTLPPPHLMPGIFPPPQMQQPRPFHEFMLNPQQNHPNNMVPNQHIQPNHLVFNPSKQQLQQQHEMHQKFQKDDINKKRTRWGDQVQLINQLTPQQLNQQHFIMPGTTMYGGNPNQKRVVLNSKHPELLSGNLMVELVKMNNRRIVDQTGKFLKYQPIKQENVPDYIYIDNRDSNALKNKLNHLLDYVDDQRENEKKFMEKKRKEKERELELKRMEEQGIDTYELRNPDKKSQTKRNIEKEVEELYAYPVSAKNEMMHQEMGIRSDGRVAGPSIQGLGGNQETVFSQFRMARSKNYHATAEERSSFRDKGSDLCFKCSRPGHIARECKYGMS